MKRIAAALALLPALALAFPDRPPPAHTGGFGEPDCSECHFGDVAGADEATLALSGIPGAWRAGGSYAIRVTLSWPGMAVAGVQLAARTQDGRQAGTWESADHGLEAVAHGDPPVVYVEHAPAPRAKQNASWRVTWKAPDVCAGAVYFDVAANAGNDDDSPFGDVIVQRRVVSRPPEDC